MVLTRDETLIRNIAHNVRMCFYDQNIFACGDYKWGNFRQHCNKEYRTGETCGMKLVMQTYPVREKCRICLKIETKQRRIEAELDRIRRWKREGSKFKASIEKSEQIVRELERERSDLINDRKQRARYVESPCLEIRADGANKIEAN